MSWSTAYESHSHCVAFIRCFYPHQSTLLVQQIFLTPSYICTHTLLDIDLHPDCSRTIMDLIHHSRIPAFIQHLPLPVTQFRAALASLGKNSQASVSKCHHSESSVSICFSTVTASVPSSPACTLPKSGIKHAWILA